VHVRRNGEAIRTAICVAATELVAGTPSLDLRGSGFAG
jgi:hypothetical protein